MVLEQWDRRVEAASRGAILFMAWRRSMPDEQIMALSALEQNPTGRRQLAKPAQALDALAQAARHVQSLHGRLDIAWGDVYRLDLDGQDHAASGSDDTLGALRRLDFSVTANNRMHAMGGDSFIAAIEFGETPRAQALLVYANSSQPGRASFKTRQADLYRQGKLRTVRWTRQDIEQSTRFAETVRDMPR
jgi:acyl-homoserine-lactone acylase